MPLPRDISSIRSHRISYITDFFLFACQLGAYIYFATFTSGHLRPYFIGHGMESDLATANKVLAYLIVLAVFEVIDFQWGYFVSYSTSKPGFSKMHCLYAVYNFFLFFVNYAFRITAVVLVCLTAYCNWNWWQYFNAIDEEFPAGNCLGLFCSAIASIPLWGCHYVLTERRERQRRRAAQARKVLAREAREARIREAQAREAEARAREAQFQKYLAKEAQAREAEAPATEARIREAETRESQDRESEARES
ncbi:hypothetical protein F4821DRAFT_280987 [Hypoxylon rubiginosum]|uniref:Uncharacterized protein n=1 Tax=Hypoxylon rubiginosum TaxID=110542 RepID=A0ACC0CSN2_9PEZI|nr:hypothetical protein F4821DRAFT_280987 [Hypoxylon rubiginosum]